MEIRPIGVVHSSVANPEEMPFEGVPARLELFPEFENGLKSIEDGTHIVVIGWLDRANREMLQVAKTRTGGPSSTLKLAVTDPNLSR